MQEREINPWIDWADPIIRGLMNGGTGLTFEQVNSMLYELLMFIDDNYLPKKRRALMGIWANWGSNPLWIVHLDQNWDSEGNTSGTSTPITIPESGFYELTITLNSESTSTPPFVFVHSTLEGVTTNNLLHFLAPSRTGHSSMTWHSNFVGGQRLTFNFGGDGTNYNHCRFAIRQLSGYQVPLPPPPAIDGGGLSGGSSMS